MKKTTCKQVSKHLSIWLLVFVTLSLPFWFSDLDIVLLKPYYTASSGWFLSTHPFWNFIYKYGIFLSYVLVFLSFIMIAVSYWLGNAIKWRKPAVFLIIVMLLGPGVLVNATFKEHWGRPRPREIKEFGGKEDYVKLWLKGDTGGKSFPSGHASTAFFMGLPFLFLIQRYKKWAWVFFIFGTLYGILMAYTRLIAGGHFASDSLWAAAMVWFSGIVAYHILGLDQHFEKLRINSPKTLQKKGAKFVFLGIVMPVLIVALMFATPYVSKNKNFSISKNEFFENNTKLIIANLNKSDVHITFADSFFVNYSVLGFGFPNGKVNWKWQSGNPSIFSFDNAGFFTSVKTNTHFYFEENSELKNQLNIKKGNVTIDVSDSILNNDLTINLQKGNITILLEKKATINLQTKAYIKNETLLHLDKQENLQALHLKINLEKEGNILVKYK